MRNSGLPLNQSVEWYKNWEAGLWISRKSHC